MYTDDNKLVKMTEPKSISFNFTKKADNSLMHEVNHIIKHNGFLTENRKKNEIEQLLFTYKHESEKNNSLKLLMKKN